MGAFLSFVGGAAKQFVSSVDKAEEDAKEMAKSSFNGLYKRYEENAESNRELTNKMKAEEDYIKTMWKGATPEQVNELLANPVALEAIKKTKNPSSISLDNYIKVIKGNESTSTGAERAAALGPLVEQVKQKMQPKETEKSGGSPIGAFFRDVGKDRMESDMAQFAKGQGLTLEEMRSNAKATRPTGSATFDMGALQEAPKNTKEMIDTLEVKRVQALQQFGKDSKEVADITGTINQITSLGATADKSPEARANRLMIAIQDAKDPEQVKDLKSQLKTTQSAIKEHKELTSTKSPSELKDVYSKMKTSVNDFVNNRMRNDKGFDWNKYYEFKTFNDPATGETITSRTQKAELKPEEQKVVFEKERQIMMNALKTNGYVINDGTPRSVVAQEFMNNFNIRAADLASDAPSPIPTAATAVQPTNPVVATKTVSIAKVQEQARANNVPYEQAAEEARKQGYTIK